VITGAHIIIYSRDPEADRTFFREVFKLSHVDVGGGWLIFGLPPSEIAVHPAETESHETWFLCNEIERFVKEMTKLGIACEPMPEQPWGRLTKITLPGGGRVGVYEPRHQRPPPMS
jgi:hypothetical protein